jgi:hypothetical protein
VPLAILLLARPARVARLVALAGLIALLSGVLALGAWPIAPLVAAVALLGAGMALGVLSPLYGRAAMVGLWTARAGVGLGACAALFPVGGPVIVVRVVAVILVVVGLRLVARGARRLGDLPSWTSTAVGAGIVAALLAPALGGGVVLAFAWLAVVVSIHGTYVASGTTAVVRV